MKQYYIYLTTNLINNKKYIGKHYGFLDDDYFGSGINIHRAILKYGKENFKKEILEICTSEQEANQKEKYYIEYFNAIKDTNFYNIADGGQGGYVTKGCSKQKRIQINKKISNAVKGEKHPMYGKHLTEETKQKIKNSLIEYWTQERRKERSEKYTGEGNPMYGKRRSKESIRKQIQHTDYSVYRTNEYREKMSLATSGSKNGNYGNKDDKAKNGRKVLMYDEQHNLIREFNTKKMALNFLNLKGHTQLDNAIKQKKLYKGYYWSQI